MRCESVLALVPIAVLLIVKSASATPGHYTSTWSVHIEGGRGVADRVADELGFVNLGEIINDHYHFHHKDVVKRSPIPCHHHHNRLNNHDRVGWVRQERILSRRKRDFLPLTVLAPTKGTGLGPEQPSDSADRPDRDLSTTERRNRLTIPITLDSQYPLNDFRWPEMWYLNRGGGLDMNVVQAWKEGYTGRGIVVTILDDGLEKDHPDLLANYDAQASYDVNNHDADPMPRYDLIDSNRHGTRCAGEVAATANNSLCAVGVAFGAGVGGVRMLDGDVTDAVEARSLSLNPQHIDIYSASWGPDDDGKTVDGPGELATRAFIEGVNKGRNGKGSIFVWASGNGGNERDNCNCDGYTNSIWTLSISSATENGDVPWYSEMCSSTLATTYSSGSSSEKQVVTTDLHHSCTSSHTGTSASAPLAAGICALALEANRDLTWRDMQHIVVRTAKPANLQPTTWRTNGVGRNVSHSFGYGLMDAGAMVRVAKTWKTVPEQHRCEISAPLTDKSIPPKSQIVLNLAVNQCSGVNYLEHVQAKISLSASRRGDLEISLTSPAGTRVTLLAPRSHDSSRVGFNMWPFMSVHTWGEAPFGIWQLEIHNEGKLMGRATLQDWSLIFYGTTSPADKNDPSPYNNVYYKINVSQSLLVPSVPVQTNKNKNKNPAKSSVNNIAYTVAAGSNPRKNKNSKNSHRNSQGKNKSIKPTVTSLRGITNKTSMYNKQYGTGKGPQRQTDSRQSTAKTNQFQQALTTTDRPRQTTASSNGTRSHKPDKTIKANNVESQHSKTQKNVSKQPSLEKKSESTTTKFQPTTRSYGTTSDDTSTNAPNFRGFIFVDQPPDGEDDVTNHKIPSHFQKYPKIQHIYPALFPYPKVEVSGSKPSRQHPPLSQFYPELYFGGPFAQDSDSDVDRDHQESRIAPDDTATLSKWNVIFYGTEVPPQETDTGTGGKSNIPGGAELSTGEGEVGQHNSLENDRTYERWSDTQKVREESRTNQQPKKGQPSDPSKSGCLSRASASPHCLECHQSLYLYSGQCYETCPAKTFPSISFTASIKPKTLAPKDVIDTTSESLRRRRQSSKGRAIMPPSTPRVCYNCHYSCQSCSGPYNYQCTTCPEDAKLFAMSSSGGIQESYCNPSHLMPDLENGMWLRRFYPIFGIIIFVACCVVFYMLITGVMKRSSMCQNKQPEVSYNRLGNVVVSDLKRYDINQELNNAIYDDTDSDG